MDVVLACLLCARISAGARNLDTCPRCGLGPLCSECRHMHPHHEVNMHGSLLPCARVCVEILDAAWRCIVCRSFTDTSTIANPGAFLKCRFCTLSPLCSKCRLPLQPTYAPGNDNMNLFHGGQYSKSRRQACVALKPFIEPNRLLFLSDLNICATCKKVHRNSDPNPAQECYPCYLARAVTLCLVCREDISAQGAQFSCSWCQLTPLCTRCKHSRKTRYLARRIELISERMLTRFEDRDTHLPAYTRTRISDDIARSIICFRMAEE